MTDTDINFAFSIGPRDQLLRMIASSPVRLDSRPELATIIAFFIIRRESEGSIDIISTSEIYQDGKYAYRLVQKKTGIPSDRVEEDLEAILNCFADGIQNNTGCRVTWHRLDLSGASWAKQITAIHAWPYLWIDE